MKKIWLLASNFNTWAGPNNHILDLCNHLYRRMGVDICLITHEAKVDEDFAKQIAFPVLRVLKGSASTPKSRLIHSYVNTTKIRETARSEGILAEEVFVNSSIDTLFSSCMAFKSKVATGYNVLSNNPHSILFNVMDKIAVTIAVEKILAHSQFQKKIYMNLGIDENRITVLPHCIDMKRVEETSAFCQNDPLEEPVIVFAGRLSQEKGVVALLNAYQRISKARASKLVIIGDGPLREYVIEQKRIIEKSSGRIDYLGWQPVSVLLNEIRKATVVAVPSLYEPFGIVAIEAMCLKKPVVASHIGGLPEIICDGFNGILVEPGKSEKLADAITELIMDPKKCSSMGSNGYITVENKFSVVKIAPKFLDFMEAYDG